MIVPWKVNIEDALLRKDMKYIKLVEFCENNGWGSICFPLEIVAKGFVVTRVHSMLEDLGLAMKDTEDVVRVVETSGPKSQHLT